MAKILFKTKGMVNPKGKPKVYFTCHPEDFDSSFDKICDDIFKTHDCAIYYTEDMTESFDELNLDMELGSMNLFVIPVSSKLLTTPSRAMDMDFAYAAKAHIPILPILIEPGIDELYSSSDKFGDLQYLNAYSTDVTEISYAEKLKKHLDSVLISDEMAKRVRAAFDAYIFLSYRKKDRRYANELIKLIHSQDDFRDVAIWFDEFLTIGESFNENIHRILSSCKLFTLLVTPNLLEEPDGKPNFVMGQEYPMAKESGMNILPTEMEKTDKQALADKFENIPECVDPYDELFKTRMADALEKTAKSECADDPEHNFLIGLAYLEGIDVEVNYDKALKLIHMAAESNLIEACQKLVEIYSDKKRADYDISTASFWQKKICDLLLQRYRETHDEQDCLTYLSAETSLAKYQLEETKLKDSRNTCWRVITLCRDNGGYGKFLNNDRIAIYVEIYSVLGDVFLSRGDFGQARECYEKAVTVYGEHLEKKACSQHISNIISYCYLKLSELLSNPPFDQEKNIRSGREYLEKALNLLIESQESIFDPSANMNLANCYVNFGNLYKERDLQKAIDAYDKAYQIYETVSKADNHCDISVYMCRLYICYGDTYRYHKSYEKAVEYYDCAIEICLKYLRKADAMEMNYYYCVACLGIINLNNSSSVRSKYEDIEENALSAAEWLVSNRPVAKYQALLADVYLSSEKNMVRYGESAFEILLRLTQEQPEMYGGNFWQCKRELWKRGILSETHFPFIRLKAAYDNKGNLYFTDVYEKKRYNFDVYFIGNNYLSDYIDEIKICQYTLQDMQDLYSYTYKVETAFKKLQLCEPGSGGTRLNPTPDEFVYVSFKGITTKEIKFQRCYG